MSDATNRIDVGEKPFMQQAIEALRAPERIRIEELENELIVEWAKVRRMKALLYDAHAYVTHGDLCEFGIYENAVMQWLKDVEKILNSGERHEG